MLNKLLKYDLKYMIGNMGVFYILSIIFAVLTRIFFSLDGGVIIEVIGQICVGVMFSMVASIMINTIMRSFVRFRDSIYRDESYLTHTLPVTKAEIYESRFIETLIFSVVGFVIILISLLIAYYTKDRWMMLRDMINGLASGLNINTTMFVILVVFILFLEIINAIQSGFLGMIFGYNRNNSKLGFSVLYGFIIYIISQCAILLQLFITGLFNSKVMDLFRSNIVIESSTLKLLLVLAIIFYIFVILFMNVISVITFNKGVNVE